MNWREEETESYLKEFRPRAVRRLEGLAPRRGAVIWFPAAAAVLLIAAAGLYGFHHRAMTLNENGRRVSPASKAAVRGSEYRSTLDLVSLAGTDDEKFEQILSEKSRTTLPSYGDEQSMLRVFAKE